MIYLARVRKKIKNYQENWDGIETYQKLRESRTEIKAEWRRIRVGEVIAEDESKQHQTSPIYWARPFLTLDLNNPKELQNKNKTYEDYDFLKTWAALVPYRLIGPFITKPTHYIVIYVFGKRTQNSEKIKG